MEPGARSTAVITGHTVAHLIDAGSFICHLEEIVATPGIDAVTLGSSEWLVRPEARTLLYCTGS